ncbi:hypothetical protein K3759_12120 [Sulfitobacter sp. W027]|uniref:hypothetical protein n=1 Tax=Sulfitobacter sp. W027 TaxID=2867025 RepID=UPI0021A72700|nr:hypothetical protein [Sulfitobacter sp. W027]UWR32687.1 hypothetical protein K3759_12120 [Sulfitobacter sp. W027]
MAEDALIEIAFRKIILTQDLETRRLEAYYGRLLLWSKMPTEPGSPEEAVEFYTCTLIALLMGLERASNHQRMVFLAEADGVSEVKRARARTGWLGCYPNGDRGAG